MFEGARRDALRRIRCEEGAQRMKIHMNKTEMPAAASGAIRSSDKREEGPEEASTSRAMQLSDAPETESVARADKPAVAVSACLLGERCTWRGDDNALPANVLERLREACLLVPVCPEVQGGLPTPRPPSEIAHGGSVLAAGEVRVVSNTGEDVTAQFEAGARAALADAQAAGCRFALLKEKSPSCGFGRIYDGTFSGVLVPGNGVAAQLFADAGIEVFGESHVDELLERRGESRVRELLERVDE